MRFDGIPWYGKRFVLEFGNFILSNDQVSEEKKQSVKSAMTYYNRGKMSELEVMHSIDGIMQQPETTKKEERGVDKITSFKDIEKLVEGKELPITGETEDGEFIMICAGRTEEGLGRSYQVETEQENGWSRIHTYWEDGTKEETFKRNDK